jgi:hypothetical protein
MLPANSRLKAKPSLEVSGNGLGYRKSLHVTTDEGESLVMSPGL